MPTTRNQSQSEHQQRFQSLTSQLLHLHIHRIAERLGTVMLHYSCLCIKVRFLASSIDGAALLLNHFSLPMTAKTLQEVFLSHIHAHEHNVNEATQNHEV